jgi:hypothetical protein
MLANFVQGYIEKYGVPDEVKKITKYCREKENGKVFPQEEEATIHTIIFYHITKNTIITVKDKDGNVIGVVMWYNCDYEDGWDFVLNWEEDKKDGDTVFIAFLFAENRKVLKKLTANLIEKEPDVLTKKLIGIRQRRGIPTKIDLSVKYFNKLLRA